MARLTYSQFKKYILFAEDFLFSISLYFIFNEQNEVKTIDQNKLKFMMTYDKFKDYLKKLEEYASKSCGIICYKNDMCQGHKTLKLMQEYRDFMLDSVQRQGLYYRYVKFIKVKNDSDLMFGYILIPIDEVDLGWRSWSQRLAFL